MRLGIAAAACLTIMACGQFALAQGSLPVVALLRVTGAEAASVNSVFSDALRAAGHENGRTIRLEEYRASNDVGHLPMLAQAIIATRPAVIVALGPTASRAVKDATSSIPIVAMAGFPVEAGLAASLARPGGNLTGVSPITDQLDAKRLSLLSEFAPEAKKIGILHDRAIPLLYRDELDAEARRLRITLDIVEVEKPSDIAPALRLARSRGAEAVNVLASPMLNASSQEVAAAARQLRLPTMCQWREMAEAGCLFSYGPPLRESYRLVAVQMDRILRGAKPADLPILQPTHFELVINVGTARAMSFELTPILFARADEVIE